MANFRKLKKSELASAAIMACQSTLPILTDSITHHVYHVFIHGGQKRGCREHGVKLL